MKVTRQSMNDVTYRVGVVSVAPSLASNNDITCDGYNTASAINKVIIRKREKEREAT
jgi:hypothetical protein